jgi:leucyl-tRNA synthetase
MSKSKGIYITLRQALDEWGADVTRMNLLLVTTGLADPDWRRENALNVARRVDGLLRLAQSVSSARVKEGRALTWLWSRLQTHIKRVTESLERMETAAASRTVFYDLWADATWYQKRSGQAVPRQFMLTWAKLLAPFTPHCAEEIWSRCGGEGFVTSAQWPRVDKKLIKRDLERLEDVLKRTIDDLSHVLRLVGKKKTAHLYVADEEFDHLADACEYIRARLGFDQVKVWRASDPERYDPESRAAKAKPGRPALYLE